MMHQEVGSKQSKVASVIAYLLYFLTYLHVSLSSTYLPAHLCLLLPLVALRPQGTRRQSRPVSRQSRLDDIFGGPPVQPSLQSHSALKGKPYTPPT